MLPQPWQTSPPCATVITVFTSHCERIIAVALVAMQLLLQIVDIFAVAFASRQFVLFTFASTQTSLLLLLQVCKMY
jgi:hypothetical protein